MARDWLPYEPVAYSGPVDLDVDACVIGTGAGGAVFASELAEAGLRVVMLEKGGLYTRRDFTQDEETMMPRLFELGGARTTADGGVVLLHGSCVGGGTTVNWAICFDPPTRVLDSWADGRGIEAIRLPELQPSLARVRRVLNVQKLKPEEVNENSRLFLRGAAALGLQADRFEHSRTGCLGSGFCILGCAYDRKQSMLVTYVPRAIRRGARLLACAEATGFEVAGGAVEAVTGLVTDPATGRRYPLRVKARHVAVAAGALSTPGLLRRAGIASPLLGENLALHPTSAVVAIFDHEVRGFEGIHYGAYADDPEGGYVLESVFAYPALAASTMLRGGEAAQRAMKDYTRMAAAIVLVHDEARGRVALTGEGPARVEYALQAHDRQAFRRGLRRLVELYLAAGAREVHVPAPTVPPIRRGASAADLDAAFARLDVAPNRLALFSAHQMGTAAMAADPERGVTDSFGRVHGTRNLWVADGSLLPTSLGVNPQITIAALADRAARRLLAEAGV